MKIAVVGTGYVGLVTGACLSDLGNNVWCVDVNEEKINALKNGEIPIYEPGLEDLVMNNFKAGTLKFTTKIHQALADSDICFIAVGTPMGEDGSADLHYVLGVAESIGQYMDHHMYIIDKSTVPVGTAQKVRAKVQEELDKRGSSLTFDVISNPEFLKEGNAIDDFMKPDRVVVGVESEKSRELMTRLYKPMLLNNFRVIFMDIPSAEMTKYAANSMLATRISFMNDIANLCELVGADVNMVRKGIGTDSRIGSKFLYSGCGYGGSCFPKDVKALIKTASVNGYTMRVLNAVEEVNVIQKNVLFEKFKKRYDGDVAGRKVAIWGLAFKPETDDMREAPALVLIDSLLKAGCEVCAYDPVAMDECKKRVGDRISYADNMYDAVIDADVIFHVTEWKEFRIPSWEAIKRLMKPNPVIIDGRNVLSEAIQNGFEYLKIG